MKRIAGLIIILAVTALAPALFAQEEHGEFGVFADYTRLHPAGNSNFFGVGGRIGFNLNRFVQLEGGMTYDFERNITSTTSNGLNTSFSRSGLRMINGPF